MLVRAGLKNQLLKQIDRLEREGGGALATPTKGIDSAGRQIPGEFAIWPRRVDIQELYEDGFHSVTTRLQARLLKGYVSNFPQLAWDPHSWFFPLWWEWRARRDRHAKTLLRAVAAGVQAQATRGMPAARANQQQLDFARSALAHWRRRAPNLRHTFCSHLAMRGAPARAIQELAGHQDLITTQRYMHLSAAAIEGAIRLLEQPTPPGSWRNAGDDRVAAR